MTLAFRVINIFYNEKIILRRILLWKAFLKITGSYVKKVTNGWKNTGKDQSGNSGKPEYMNTWGVPFWNLFFIIAEEVMTMIGIGKSDKKSINFSFFTCQEWSFVVLYTGIVVIQAEGPVV